MRLFALFNLKPGVSVADYEAWAKSADLPTVNVLPSIKSFEVFRMTGRLGNDLPSPYQYIEVLDVVDMDQFGNDVATPKMREIAGAFQAMADVIFLTSEQLGA